MSMKQVVPEAEGGTEVSVRPAYSPAHRIMVPVAVVGVLATILGFVLVPKFSTGTGAGVDVEDEQPNAAPVPVIQEIPDPIASELNLLSLRLEEHRARIEALMDLDLGGVADSVRGLDARAREIERRLEVMSTKPVTESDPSASEEALNQRMDAVEERLKGVDWLARDAHAKLKRALKGSEAKVQSPPFRLLAVDVWGGQRSAVVRTGEQVKFLREHEELLGWTLRRLMDDAAVFVKGGIELELEAAR